MGSIRVFTATFHEIHLSHCQIFSPRTCIRVTKNAIIGEITPHTEPLILDLANMEEGGPTGEVNFEEWDDGNKEWRNYIKEKTREWVKGIIARSMEEQTDRGRHDEEDRA